ncbi:MAG TPA: CvpA family protein [Methylocystis sp.]|nr:CvpA family protein [Methylocystis sp.]
MPSYLDLAVLGIVLVSALLALLRGFTREVLAILSWVVAGAAGYAEYKHPMLLEYVKRFVPNEKFAPYVSIGAAFLVALIVVSIVTVKISDLILDSKIGALDRTLGFIFGAARGMLLAVVAFFFYNWLAHDDTQPEWVRNARMKPFLEAGGERLGDLIPQDIEKQIEAAVASLKHKKGAPANDEPPSESDTDTGRTAGPAAEKKS